jgi:hypothetical protein
MSLDNDLFSRHSEWLADQVITDQEDMETFLRLTKESSWDIPSALGSLCDHVEDPATNYGDFYMHINPANWDDDEELEALAIHFKDVHSLDLTVPDINWSFDT